MRSRRAQVCHHVERGVSRLEVLTPVAKTLEFSVKPVARWRDWSGVTVGLYWKTKAGGDAAPTGRDRAGVLGGPGVPDPGPAGAGVARLVAFPGAGR